MRRRGLLHPTISIALQRLERYVWLSTDSGRALRPLIRVKDGVPMLREAVEQIRRASKDGNPMNAFSVTAFEDPDAPVRKSTGGVDGEVALELLDPWELEGSYIAMTPETVTRDHTHMEIHPSMMFGVMGMMIPYAPHNQAPRNLYSCAQSKQATSIYSKAFRSRYDHSAMILTSTQRPITNTWWGRQLGGSGLAYGTNLIVAIMCFSGYNQEDGVLVNKTSVERGLFRVIKTEEMSSVEEYEEGSKTKIRIIDPRTVPGIKTKQNADYGYLDEDGTLLEGTRIKPGMVLFGRVSETEGEIPRDVSIVAGRFAKGIVESKITLRVTGGHRLVRYRLAMLRSPEFGDKFSSRAGQKGTCGMLIAQEDMPRTAEGIVPDLIVNPHAIPSRMTIGQIQESVISKLGCILGTEIDSTAFSQNGVFGPNIENLLLANGYDPRGDEMLYSGVTGEILHSKIFMGPTYYMRLKHMVQDKINFRSGGVERGPVDAKTRQPIGGRAREGGLRVGEMERDTIVSYGASRFLQESHTTRSDGQYSLVCADSGKGAFVGDGKNVYPGLRSIERDGPFHFRGSRTDTLENTTDVTNSTHFSEISMPRALNLLLQEVETMGVETRILTEGGTIHLRHNKDDNGLTEDDIEHLLNQVDDELPIENSRNFEQSDLPPIRIEQPTSAASKEEGGLLGTLTNAVTGFIGGLGGEGEQKEEEPRQTGEGRHTKSQVPGSSMLKNVLNEQINERHNTRMALQRMHEGFGRELESGSFGIGAQRTAEEHKGEQVGAGLLDKLRQQHLQQTGSVSRTEQTGNGLLSQLNLNKERNNTIEQNEQNSDISTDKNNQSQDGGTKEIQIKVIKE